MTPSTCLPYLDHVLPRYFMTKCTRRVLKINYTYCVPLFLFSVHSWSIWRWLIHRTYTTKVVQDILWCTAAKRSGTRTPEWFWYPSGTKACWTIWRCRESSLEVDWIHLCWRARCIQKAVCSSGKPQLARFAQHHATATVVGTLVMMW